MRPADPIKELVQKLNDRTSAEMDRRVLTDVLAALAESQKPSALTRPKIWRNMMQTRITKLAVAVVLATVILIGMNQFIGSSTGVAWGEVVRKVSGSPGVICRRKQVQKHREQGTIEFTLKVYASAAYGIRTDDYFDPEHSLQAYGTLKEGANILIDHSSKTYERQLLTGEERAELEELDSRLKFSDILSLGYRELGRKIINGVEAEGVETTNPEGPNISSSRPIVIDSYVAQLWVSVETNLPIFFESKTVWNNGTWESHIVMDEFQWDVELDASVFEPDIPEDYTQIGTADPHKGTDARLKKWRFKEKDPESGKYRLRSEDGQYTATIPEAWADSPEHAVRVKEELDLQKQQGKRKLLAVNEIEVDGQLGSRFLFYEHNLSDGQTIRTGEFDPDDSGRWTAIQERRAALGKEVHRLWQEQRRQAEEGQELATTEERQVEGRVFTFKKWRLVLSDGREAVYSRGRLKDEQ